MKYKITINYRDGDTHTIPGLNEIELLAWIVSFLKNEVLNENSSIKSWTVEVE